MGPRKRKADDLIQPARNSERVAVQESLKLNVGEAAKKMKVRVVAATANGGDIDKTDKSSGRGKTTKPPEETKSVQEKLKRNTTKVEGETVARKRPKKEPPTRENEDLDVATDAGSPDIIAAPVVSSQKMDEIFQQQQKAVAAAHQFDADLKDEMNVLDNAHIEDDEEKLRDDVERLGKLIVFLTSLLSNPTKGDLDRMKRAQEPAVYSRE